MTSVLPDANETMRRSKVEIYVHCVWTTHERKCWITPQIERAIYHCIEGQARNLGCVVLSINGTEDHVHLLVQLSTTTSIANLMKQVKGVSSALVNDRTDITERFRWQEGYGAFSVSRSHLNRVIAYIQNQKVHHTTGDTWPQWEETWEEISS